MLNSLLRSAHVPALALPLVCAVIIGCAEPSSAPGVSETLAPTALVTPWRTVMGGFLAQPGVGFGPPARPGSGAFVKLVSPTAVALRGNDMLIVDSGAGRTYRSDVAFNTLVPIAGAPSAPGTAVALGSDLSAWILDLQARQVLRFARDGRLLQTFRASAQAPSPVAFALLDEGAALMVADATLGQLVEFRSVGAFAIPVIPKTGPDQRIADVSAVAAAREGLFVLDRNAGVVHQIRRDGSVIASLGQGELKQPAALVADRFDRVFVTEPFNRTVQVLQAGEPTQTLTAAQLGVQQISALAVDARLLAVADGLAGQVVIHTLREGPRR